MPTKKTGDDKKPLAAPRRDEGSRLLRMGLAREAAREFEKALSQAPADEAALRGLARARLALGEAELARAALDKLLAARPDDLEAQSHAAALDAQRGVPGAVDRLRALAAKPEAGFFQHFNLATALAAAGDLDGAEKAFKAAADLEPDGPYAWFELGMLAMRRSDFATAASRFTKAVQLSPSEWAPRLMLSRTQAAQGAVGPAVRTLTEAIVLAPREPALHEDMFKLCMVAGSPQGAIKSAIELRQLAPENANYTYLHGLATLAVGLVPQAKEVFELALRQAPGSWEVKQALSQACSLTGDVARAQGLLEEVAEQRPEEPGPANDLAVLYLRTRETTPRVPPLLRRVLQVHPDHAGTNLNMALALASTERAAAAAHARKALAAADAGIREQAEKLLLKLGAR